MKKLFAALIAVAMITPAIAGPHGNHYNHGPGYNRNPVPMHGYRVYHHGGYNYSAQVWGPVISFGLGYYTGVYAAPPV